MKQMNCKEVQKKIHCFVTDEMSDQELVPFVRHIEHCKDCKEELTIEYLVIIGMQRLDESGTFDLENELEEKIQKRMERAAFKKQVQFMIMTLACAGAIAAGYFLAMSLFY